MSLIERDEMNLSPSLGLINLLIYKSRPLDSLLMEYYPILCYLVIGKPRGDIKGRLESLPEQYCDLLNTVDESPYWQDCIASIGTCLMNYVVKLGTSLKQRVDLFGRPYIELLFDVIRKIGEKALDSKSTALLVYAPKLASCLLESLPGEVDEFLPTIVELSKELLNMTDEVVPQTAVSSLLSVCVCYNPATSLKLMNQTEVFDG